MVFIGKRNSFQQCVYKVLLLEDFKLGWKLQTFVYLFSLSLVAALLHVRHLSESFRAKKIHSVKTHYNKVWFKERGGGGAVTRYEETDSVH